MHTLNAKINSVAVAITCVDYDDYLRHTLTQTLRHFSNVTVITAERDRNTVQYARSIGVKVFVSDLWFKDGSPFNKSAAINQWLSFQPLAWTLMLDADIYLPDTFMLDPSTLNSQSLYSIPRRICENERDWVCPENQRPKYPLVIPPVRNGMVWRRPTSNPAALSGYFQLWNREKSGKLFFPSSITAADYDVEFALQFSDIQRVYLPGEVIHLGPIKQNWSGRVSATWALIQDSDNVR